MSSNGHLLCKVRTRPTFASLHGTINCKWLQIKQFTASYCLTIYRGCSFEDNLVWYFVAMLLLYAWDYFKLIDNTDLNCMLGIPSSVKLNDIQIVLWSFTLKKYCLANGTDLQDIETSANGTHVISKCVLHSCSYFIFLIHGIRSFPRVILSQTLILIIR